MTDEDKSKIQEFIEENSMESIVEVYIESNCYMPLVQIIMDTLNQRLNKLEKLERVFNEK